MKKIIDSVLRGIYIILSLSIFILLFLVPFFSEIINPVLAGILIGISSIYLFVNSFFMKNAMPININTITSILLIYIFTGIFIINYFDSGFTWAWYIFILILLIIPYSVIIFHNFMSQEKRFIREKSLFISNMIKYVFFYVVIDLFYMSFIIDNLVCKYVFGVLAILIIFTSSLQSFIKNEKPHIISLLHDIFCGIFLIIYLISIIENSELRTITTNIISSLIGGYVTLLGVAWTIRDNTNNRKEDDKKTRIPYLLINPKPTKDVLNCIAPTKINSEIYDEKTTEHIQIVPFQIKNSNNSDCVLKSINVCGKNIAFRYKEFLERGQIIGISLFPNDFYIEKDSVPEAFLVVEDVLKNEYKLYLNLKAIGSRNDLDTGEMIKDYVVRSLSLPEDNVSDI